MIEYIYVVIIIAWVALLLGFLIKEIWILMFAGLIMMVLGINTLTQGLVGVNNNATQIFSFLNMFIGFYVLIRSVEEVITNG